MNFKITEKTRTFWDTKPEFIKLYNQGVMMKHIREKLELTSTQYNKLVRECSQEGSITARRKTQIKKWRGK